MILTKLAAEYERLVEQGKLDRPGWNVAKVSYALELDADGQLIAVQSLLITETTENKKGKVKTVVHARNMPVPEQAKRSSGIDANFLCDNCNYILGIDTKGKPERTRDCFLAAGKRHHELLDGVDEPIARAICSFFDSWKPEEAEEHSVIKPYLDEIKKGGNLIFCYETQFAQENPAIREAWQRCYDSGVDDIIMQCLDVGRPAPVAILHPNIKGVRGAKSTGASLVSFNAPSYESYGRNGSQGLNAPVSKYTAFAYGAALNYLLADYNRVQVVGDTTVVCWAESGNEGYQDFLCDVLMDSGGTLNDGDVQNAVKRLADGKRVELNGVQLGPEEPFYILGLAPNAARISVRFFLQGTFGEFAKNVDCHYQRLEIQRPAGENGEIPIWRLLQETVNQNASDKSPKPQLAGDMLRAILTNTRYPATLLQTLEIRIRAEREINWRRAAILKAVLLQNYKENQKIQEAATVKLNEQCSYAPYVLGRIFSMYEYIQRAANPTVNTTIRDRYFNAAAATPASVFGTLGRLSQSHLKKLSNDPKTVGQKNYCEKKLGELYNMLDELIPARLNLQDQAAFQIGYYHQTSANYTKKNADSEQGGTENE